MSDDARRLGVVVFPTGQQPKVPDGTIILDGPCHVPFSEHLDAIKISHPILGEVALDGPLPVVKPVWDGERFEGWVTNTRYEAKR